MDIESLINREELTIANRQKRISAMLIDDLLLSILLVIILFDKITNIQTIEEIIFLTNQFVLEFMFIKIMYQTFFVYKYGATIGKMFVKIRVVSLRGANGHTVSMAFNRAVFRIISEILFYLGFLWGIFDKYSQTWHDKTAKTIVINAD